MHRRMRRKLDIYAVNSTTLLSFACSSGMTVLTRASAFKRPSISNVAIVSGNFSLSCMIDLPTPSHVFRPSVLTLTAGLVAAGSTQELLIQVSIPFLTRDASFLKASNLPENPSHHSIVAAMIAACAHSPAQLLSY